MIDFGKVKNSGAREAVPAPGAFSARTPTTGPVSMNRAPTGPAAPVASAPAAGTVAQKTAAPAAPVASVGMNLPYKTPEQWGQASDYYKGVMSKVPSTDPMLSKYQQYNEDLISGGGMAGSMDDYARAYDAKYAQDKLDTRDQVLESMNSEGLGDSSVAGVQMQRELGRLANDRAMNFADRQTALDEAAKGRVMAGIGAYGQGAGLGISDRQTQESMGLQAADRAGLAGDRVWRSIDEAGGRYTGLAGAYNDANYNAADQGLDSMLRADIGTTQPTTYDQGTLGRIGGVVGGVGSMINNDYFKKKKPVASGQPGFRFTG